VSSSVITKPSFSISTVKTPLSWTPSTVVLTKKWSRISKTDKSGSKRRLLALRSRNKFFRRSLTSLKSPKKILRKMRSLDPEPLLAERQQRKSLRRKPRRPKRPKNKKSRTRKNVSAKKRRSVKRKKKRRPRLPQPKRVVQRNPQPREKKSLKKLRLSQRRRNRE
jgi:hypothetical protein